MTIEVGRICRGTLPYAERCIKLDRAPTIATLVRYGEPGSTFCSPSSATMEYPKKEYEITHAPVEQSHEDHVLQGSKAIAIGEAADVYGDVATAEHYGYVERGYGRCTRIFRLDC